ncbi:MAG: decaprenyl-phosphate phosphoribosyltransferase [Ignavibacteriales bacterium]|nr:decaprenyl-phosphate phosphoribosyltransferase [Ignavibacteriales bacterium]
MFSKFFVYLKLLRVTSWLKNVFVFVPLVFSKHLFDAAYFSEVLLGFIAFSFTSSLIYVLNDIVDAEKDKIHSEKKNRPIPSGQISKSEASIVLMILFFAVLFFSYLIRNDFVILLWAYVVINSAYTFYLKQVVIVDLFCIAAGFILRMIAGAVIISVYISNWLILTTIFISLFLAVMKRRVEIATSTNAVEQRTVLKDYSLSFIDQVSAITAGGVIICYALYTVAERTVLVFGTERLVFTTIFVVFGIFRYMFLVYKKNIGENVAEVIYSDPPMIINAMLFLLVAFYIIYI